MLGSAASNLARLQDSVARASQSVLDHNALPSDQAVKARVVQCFELASADAVVALRAEGDKDDGHKNLSFECLELFSSQLAPTACFSEEQKARICKATEAILQGAEVQFEHANVEFARILQEPTPCEVPPELTPFLAAVHERAQYAPEALEELCLLVDRQSLLVAFASIAYLPNHALVTSHLECLFRRACAAIWRTYCFRSHIQVEADHCALAVLGQLLRLSEPRSKVAIVVCMAMVSSSRSASSPVPWRAEAEEISKLRAKVAELTQSLAELRRQPQQPDLHGYSEQDLLMQQVANLSQDLLKKDAMISNMSHEMTIKDAALERLRIEVNTLKCEASKNVFKLAEQAEIRRKKEVLSKKKEPTPSNTGPDVSASVTDNLGLVGHKRTDFENQVARDVELLKRRDSEIFSIMKQLERFGYQVQNIVLPIKLSGKEELIQRLKYDLKMLKLQELQTSSPLTQLSYQPQAR